MIISIWRYSHLTLAVSSFLLLILASVTGVILAFKPLTEKIQPYRSEAFDDVSLAVTLPMLRQKYPQISSLTVDENDFVKVKGTGDSKQEVYVDPVSGSILGHVAPENAFFEWITALHRSLFLHEAGRFFVGLAAFLLMLITISGTILIIQRQRGIRRFFTRILRDHFAQYYHILLGRLSLIPIFLIALSGTYLSLERFGIIQTKEFRTDVDFDKIRTTPQKKSEDFAIFKKTPLSEVRSVEFPFSEDAEDYYILTLRDRQITVNQLTGDILTEDLYSLSSILVATSLDLHTGRSNAIWALILALASGNILFFIYSGFAITLRRLSGRVKNQFSPSESEIVILVGSENGSTFHFANAIHNQLISQGKKSAVTELDKYTTFPNASHLIVMCATYGTGEAPANSRHFLSRLHKYAQPGTIKFSVVGFGSHSYPDFCRFAYEADRALGSQSWATPLLEIHTVNDKSPQEFSQWASNWAQHAGIALSTAPNLTSMRQEAVSLLTVTGRTVSTAPGDTFLIRFDVQPTTRFTSGDLLAVYPADDHRERLYSIAKMEEHIQLSVKWHENGLGSEFLNALQTGQAIKGRLINHPHFHFPVQAPAVIMVSNGTGINPFLGMIIQKAHGTPCYLYAGFRNQDSFSLYKTFTKEAIRNGSLTDVHIAYSREENNQYVADLLLRDEALVANLLKENGAMMLCGSLAMQNSVLTVLEQICQNHLQRSVSYFQARGQVLMDCY